MSSRTQFGKKSYLLSALILTLVLSCVFTFPAQAKNVAGTLPDLESFIETVIDGDGSVLRGVYVPDVMALSIIQQPEGFPGFVSQNLNQVTQFGMAAEAGNVGLLAHNYLSGQLFSFLAQGDNVVLVYGDGSTESFVVTYILQYQALNPTSPYSDFKDLETQSIMSAEQLFNQVYRDERHITFQTCIEAEGDLNWGRLFVIAEPTSDTFVPITQTYFGNTFQGRLRKR